MNLLQESSEKMNTLRDMLATEIGRTVPALPALPALLAKP